MKNYLFVSFVLLLPLSVFGLGFSVTEENDFLRNKDNNYTQGAEISLDENCRDANGTIIARNFYGVRSRMYSPQNITNPTNQPNDRPWACVTDAFYERRIKEGKETVRYGVELGVLGPWAFGKCEQTTVHRWISNKLPQGWSNQVPNEISIDVYMLRYYPILRFGNPSKLSINLDLPYGTTLGTTYDNLQIGKAIKMGWNIPPNHLDEGIAPKVFIQEPFIYVLADINEKYVIHNATLGHSFFRNSDKWDRDLKPLVTEWHYGVCAGYKNFAVTYLLADRSHEFKGQPEQMRWGMMRLEWMLMF